MRRVMCFACTSTAQHWIKDSLTRMSKFPGSESSTIITIDSVVLERAAPLIIVHAPIALTRYLPEDLKANLKLQAVQHNFNAASNQPHPVHHCGLLWPIICPARVVPSSRCTQGLFCCGIQLCKHPVELSYSYCVNDERSLWQGCHR